MRFRGTIPYTKIEPDGDLLKKVGDLEKIGLEIDDILYINTKGKVSFQRLSRDSEPFGIGEIVLKGLIDKTVRDTAFGSHIIICENGGEAYLNRIINIAKRNHYHTRPIG